MPAHPAPITGHAAAPAPPASRPPVRIARPLGGLVVAVLLLVAAIPLTSGLRSIDTMSSRELTGVLTAQATWQRQAALAGDGLTLNRLVPVLNHKAVVDRPPGLAWLQVLAILPLETTHHQAPGNAMLFRTRLVSVGCALVALGAVFWAGTQLGGLGTATLAGLVFLANPLWLVYGRSATAEAPAVAAALLAASAALWAMRPLRPAAKLRRQISGYTLCGLLLGVSTLVGGATVAAAVMLPLAVMSLFCPRRTGHLLGLTAAAALAVLLTVPWVLYNFQTTSPPPVGGLRRLVGATWPSAASSPTQVLAIISQRGFALLVSGGVWSMVIAAAALAPWVIAGEHARRRATMTWVWGALSTLLALFGPAWLNADGRGWAVGVLLATPALALVAAQLLAYAADLAQDGQTARAWRLIRWPTALGVTVASAALPWWWIHQHPDASLRYPLMGGGLLLAAALLGIRSARDASPGPATLAWALWTVTATTLLNAQPQSHGWPSHVLRDGPSLSAARLDERLDEHQHDPGWPAALPRRRATTAPPPDALDTPPTPRISTGG